MQCDALEDPSAALAALASVGVTMRHCFNALVSLYSNPAESVAQIGVPEGDKGELVATHATFGAATLAPGSAIKASGTLTLTPTSSIIAGSQGGLNAEPSVSLEARDNLFWQAPLVGQGKEADPQFVNPAAGDYRLRVGSPAIDGAPGSRLTVDLLGTTRPQGAAADVGAYEYVPGGVQ